jgi:hypothetical protein
MMEKSRMLQTRDSNVMVDYRELMIHLAPSMVPGREWELVKSGHNSFSEVVTSTDEAHALLVIENNWNRLKFGENLEGKDRDKCKEIKWITEADTALFGCQMPRYTRTDGGRPRNGRQGKTGWSQCGLDRFNELVKVVREGRKTRGNIFDTEVKKRCRDMAEEKLRKRKRKRARNKEEEEAFQKLEQFQVACDFNYEAV